MQFASRKWRRLSTFKKKAATTKTVKLLSQVRCHKLAALALFLLCCIWPTNMLISLIRRFQVTMQIYRFSSKMCPSVKMQIYGLSWKFVRSYEINLHLCLSRIVACQESMGSPICRVLITHSDSYTLIPSHFPLVGYLTGRWIKAFAFAAKSQEEAKVTKSTEKPQTHITDRGLNA